MKKIKILFLLLYFFIYPLNAYSNHLMNGKLIFKICNFKGVSSKTISLIIHDLRFYQKLLNMTDINLNFMKILQHILVKEQIQKK